MSKVWNYLFGKGSDSTEWKEYIKIDPSSNPNRPIRIRAKKLTEDLIIPVEGIEGSNQPFARYGEYYWEIGSQMDHLEAEEFEQIYKPA